MTPPKKPKLFTIGLRCGRLANRMILFANFVALAEEQGHRLINFTFHMMAATYTHPVYTYQFKITNTTTKEQTYIIKPPNIPSPFSLPPSRTFPALYTCTLPPSGSQTFTTEILSNSQGKSLYCFLNSDCYAQVASVN